MSVWLDPISQTLGSAFAPPPGYVLSSVLPAWWIAGYMTICERFRFIGFESSAFQSPSATQLAASYALSVRVYARVCVCKYVRARTRERVNACVHASFILPLK